jgi:hypothetical protein
MSRRRETVPLNSDLREPDLNGVPNEASTPDMTATYGLRPRGDASVGGHYSSQQAT